jgi:hypothetical protein
MILIGTLSKLKELILMTEIIANIFCPMQFEVSFQTLA